MKTAAIIAEYNPFHNGHRYQIEKTRQETGADFFLALMSGDFVQRGAPAFADKYTRTRMALLGGADVVIELPALYALSSAEYFAQGAVSLLERLNTVDVLSFGSESGNLTLFERCARILVENQGEINRRTGPGLKGGLSFPAARAKAVAELLSMGGAHVRGEDVACKESPDTRSTPRSKSEDGSDDILSILSCPNNILGLEYCKALATANSRIRPFTLKRKGCGYHDPTLILPEDGSCALPENTSSASPDDASSAPSEDASRFASASALRNALSRDPSACRGFVPDEIFEQFSCLRSSSIVTEEDFSGLLHYRLLAEQDAGFSDYLDCTPALSDKIRRHLPLYTGFSSFCHLLKSRELTYTRISRVLIHILLNMKTPEAFGEDFRSRSLPAPYARLLGFKKSAAPLLSSLEKNSSIPLISKLADAKRLLPEDDLRMLRQDIYCAEVFESVRRRPGAPMRNEWKQSPIVLDDSSR